MVLEWTPEEASLLQDRPFSAAASVYISREAWEAQTLSSISELRTRGQETLYETCACISCIRGLSQIVFPTVSVIMTLRGGGV